MLNGGPRLQAGRGLAGAAMVGETGVVTTRTAGAADESAVSSAVAVVLTYRRPQGASEVVLDLLENEALEPDQVVLVVNGDGGLNDPELEKAIRVISLPYNAGPAGAFAHAMRYVRDRSEARWVYLCEDDQKGYHGLPSPRLRSLIDEVERFQRDVPGRRQQVEVRRQEVGHVARRGTRHVGPAARALRSGGRTYRRGGSAVV